MQCTNKKYDGLFGMHAKQWFALMGLLLLISSTYFAAAQSVKISSNIDTSSILIGDHLQLQFQATYNPLQYKVQFPNVADTFQHFEVVERSKIDTSFGRDENTYTQKITLTNFDSGVWKIASLPFDIQPLNGTASQVLYSDSFLVQVQTIAVDTSKPFKPIFGIRSAKMPWQVLLKNILLGLGIALLIGYLIWYLIKRYRAKKVTPALEPEITLLPHEQALQALAKVEQDAWWEIGREKEYHTQLTDIIRTYLEKQFNIDCFEKTSSEIIQQIKKIKALSTSRQALRTIFETSDMVKFAKSKPSTEEHLQSMQLAKEFILESYKRVKPTTIQPNDTQTL